MREQIKDFIRQVLREDPSLLEEIQQFEVAEGFREDGWSIETSHGCRKHQDLEALRAEWQASDDPVLREAAREVPIWWGFADVPEPGQFRPHLGEDLSDDEISDLLRARGGSFGVGAWGTGGIALVMPNTFWLDRNAGISAPRHAYLTAPTARPGDQVETILAEMPEWLMVHADNIADNIRNARDPNQPQPSPSG